MFPAQAAEDIWGGNSEALISAGYYPVGKVERLDGAWRLSGKWGWVSGCDFADWFLFGALVPDDEAGMVHNFGSSTFQVDLKMSGSGAASR